MAASDEPRDETAPAERVPAFVAVPVEFLEALAALRVPARTWPVLLAVVVRTVGADDAGAELRSTEIGQMTNYSPRSVRLALSDLARLGLIERESPLSRHARIRLVTDPAQWSPPVTRQAALPATRQDGGPGTRQDGMPGTRQDGLPAAPDSTPLNSYSELKSPEPSQRRDCSSEEEAPTRQDVLPGLHAPDLQLDTRVDAWVNVLGGEDRDAKVTWLREHLALIEAEAHAWFKDVTPTVDALRGKIKALILRYWRKHQHDLTQPRGRREGRSDWTDDWEHGL